MRLDPRERKRELGLRELRLALRVRPHRARRTLPNGPCARGRKLLGRRALSEPAVIRAEQIAAFLRRDRREERPPLLREQHARAPLIEPVDLLAAQQENAAQHELADRARMRLGVGERESAAPRAAEHEPAVDIETAAQSLHVGDQIPGRVGLERRVRPTTPRAALIEDHDPIAVGIEEAPRVHVAAAAGTAVHEQRRLAARVARLLVIDLVPRANLHEARVERLDRVI